jgi:hypothetical protein
MALNAKWGGLIRSCKLKVLEKLLELVSSLNAVTEVGYISREGKCR